VLWLTYETMQKDLAPIDLVLLINKISSDDVSVHLSCLSCLRGSMDGYGSRNLFSTAGMVLFTI
jgi:hypothetical protein